MTRCIDCQRRIEGRGPQAKRCDRCHEVSVYAERRQRTEAHRAARQPGVREDVPRDVELEARIDAHLRRIRREGRYRLSDELIWARRTDVLAERAGGWEDVGLLSREKTRGWRRATKAHRQAVEAGQAAAVAAVDSGEDA